MKRWQQNYTSSGSSSTTTTKRKNIIIPDRPILLSGTGSSDKLYYNFPNSTKENIISICGGDGQYSTTRFFKTKDLLTDYSLTLLNDTYDNTYEIHMVNDDQTTYETGYYNFSTNTITGLTDYNFIVGTTYFAIKYYAGIEQPTGSSQQKETFIWDYNSEPSDYWKSYVSEIQNFADSHKYIAARYVGTGSNRTGFNLSTYYGTGGGDATIQPGKYVITSKLSNGLQDGFSSYEFTTSYGSNLKGTSPYYSSNFNYSRAYITNIRENYNNHPMAAVTTSDEYLIRKPLFSNSTGEVVDYETPSLGRRKNWGYYVVPIIVGLMED